ncbi:DUF3263 domain-containing protein [Streptomyces sp. NPDC006687]|uniref:DUF3263 domain-containing protein n=1 Tax=unclassified Streptomyces TaxID=2593676 RepID=UPI00340965E3
MTDDGRRDGQPGGETGGEAGVVTGAASSRLTDAEAAVLAYEGRSWPGPGAKERAIREGLGLSPVRYYQLLNTLMDDPRALAHAPTTVNRLRRLREAQRARR